MKILALDYGKKRIGVALGDTHFGIAFAREHILNKEKVFETIKELCEQEGIEKIIIGKPTLLSGEESDSTSQVLKFTDKLQKQLIHFGLQIPTEFVDERLSTNIAQNRLNSGLAEQSKKKELIDSSSAQVILESYLGRFR